MMSLVDEVKWKEMMSLDDEVARSEDEDEMECLLLGLENGLKTDDKGDDVSCSLPLRIDYHVEFEVKWLRKVDDNDV